MNFALATVTLALVTATAPGAQARKMRANRELRDLEEFDGLDLSSMSSMSAPAALKENEIENPITRGSYTFSGQTSTSADPKFIAAKFKSSAGQRESKTDKSSGVCDERLNILYDAMNAANYFFDPYETCGLDPYYLTNWRCPTWYGPPGLLGFSDGQLSWWDATENYYKPFWELFFGLPPAAVMQAWEMFCECYSGYELGCAAKIPRQGDDLAFHGDHDANKKWVDYCKVAGVWNGDFDIDDFENPLTAELQDCGCYFISVMKEKVDSCPGVNLGEFY